MFTLSTLFVASCAQFTQLSFIDNRNFPGGPSAYQAAMFYIPVDNMGNGAFVISDWLAEGLLIWRYFTIYRRCRIPMWILMFFPTLMFLSSVAMGILYLIQVSSPASSPWSTNFVNFTLPYAAISFALNIIITILVVGRILVYRYRIEKAIGDGYGKEYTGIAAMLIESASLFAAFSLFFLITFALNSPLENIPLQCVSQIQAISTLLIIYRVARGRAWSYDTSTLITDVKPNHTIKFARVRNLSEAHADPLAGVRDIIPKERNGSALGSLSTSQVV